MIHKFYAVKDDNAIKRGTVISTIFAIVVSGGSYFLGGFGRLFVTQEEITTVSGKLAYDSIIPKLLETAIPEVLVGIVVVLVLSASMSTLSALVLTSSSTLIIDLIKPRFKNGLGEKNQVFLMRIFIAVFIVLSVVIALNPNAYITTLMSISWGALSGAFLAPFMYGLFSKKITKPAVWTSFIAGTGITIIHMFLFSLGFFPSLTEKVRSLGLSFNILSPINAGAFAMIMGLVLVPVVSAFTRKSLKKDEAYVEEVFTCYKG